MKSQRGPRGAPSRAYHPTGRTGGRRGWHLFLVSVAVSLGMMDCSTASTPSGRDGGDEAPLEKTCQQIRQCVWTYCNNTDPDQPCVQNCMASSSVAARSAFEALLACSNSYCPSQETYCGCEQHCFVDGNCLAEAAACSNSGSDLVCDMLCH